VVTYAGDLVNRAKAAACAVPGGPCIVYMHRGAFVKGSLDSGNAVAWGVAAASCLVARDRGGPALRSTTRASPMS
jgi:acetyl esterase/lipase